MHPGSKLTYTNWHTAALLTHSPGRAAVDQTEALDGGSEGAWGANDPARIPLKPVLLNSQARLLHSALHTPVVAFSSTQASSTYAPERSGGLLLMRIALDRHT